MEKLGIFTTNSINLPHVHSFFPSFILLYLVCLMMKVGPSPCALCLSPPVISKTP